MLFRSTDELSDGFVDFDQSVYLGQVVGQPDYATRHEIGLTNLEPGKTYYFRAGSSDRSGNGPVESPVDTFTTLLEPDVVPPSVPSGVAATAGPGAVLLTWEPVEEADWAGYTVYRQNAQRRYVAVATGLKETRYVDEGLDDGRTYRYRISALDGQVPANESAQSGVVSARPDAQALGTPPSIAGLEQGAEAGRPVVVVHNGVPSDSQVELSYTIQVSTEADFSTVVDREGNIAESLSGTTRWRVGRTLAVDTAYWFRARVFDGVFAGPWSEAVSLRPSEAIPSTQSEDFDGDGLVGMRDFFILASGFGSVDPMLDLDQGGVVDGADVARFTKRFGQSIPGKRLGVRKAGVAEGTQVAVSAQAVSADQVEVRLDLSGVKQLSGYGFSLAIDPPILAYMGRADSALFGGAASSLRLEHDGSVLSIGEHLRGRQGALDLEEGWSIALRFALKGAPQNVELRVEEGFLGVGRGRMLTVEQVGRARIVPQVYALYANYPNPFNPSTVIPLAIPEGAAGRSQGAQLTLYNVLGQQVRVWDVSGYAAGFHALRWDGRDGQGRAVASGVYLIRLQAGDVVQVRKALLLR